MTAPSTTITTVPEAETWRRSTVVLGASTQRGTLTVAPITSGNPLRSIDVAGRVCRASSCGGVPSDGGPSAPCRPAGSTVPPTWLRRAPAGPSPHMGRPRANTGFVEVRDLAAIDVDLTAATVDACRRVRDVEASRSELAPYLNRRHQAC